MTPYLKGDTFEKKNTISGIYVDFWGCIRGFVGFWDVATLKATWEVELF